MPPASAGKQAAARLALASSAAAPCRTRLLVIFALRERSWTALKFPPSARKQPGQDRLAKHMTLDRLKQVRSSCVARGVGHAGLIKRIEREHIMMGLAGRRARAAVAARLKAARSVDETARRRMSV